MRFAKRFVLWGLAVAVAAVFAVTVWPTRYRMDHMSIRRIGLQPVRTDRFTGETEALYPSGWEPLQSVDKPHNAAPAAREMNLPSDQLARITGRGGIKGSPDYATFEASMYNGSDWRITELRVSLAVGDVSRHFRLSGTAEPLTSSDFSARVDSGTYITWLEHGSKGPEWDIAGAKGYPPPGYGSTVRFRTAEHRNRVRKAFDIGATVEQVARLKPGWSRSAIQAEYDEWDSEGKARFRTQKYRNATRRNFDKGYTVDQIAVAMPNLDESAIRAEHYRWLADKERRAPAVHRARMMWLVAGAGAILAGGAIFLGVRRRIVKRRRSAVQAGAAVDDAAAISQTHCG